MKITQVLKETQARRKKIIKEAATPTEADLKQYFIIHGDVEFTPDGIVVEGDIESKRGKKLTEIPFKFHKVTGSFDMQDYKDLESLVNFPRICGHIEISGNEAMEHIEGGEDIICDKFQADWSNLVDLTGVPKAKHYSFNGSTKLSSTKGLPMDEIRSIDLGDCLNLKNIKNLTAPVGNTRDYSSKISYNSNLPLIGLILLAGQKDRLQFEIDTRGVKVGNSAMIRILQDYRGRGLGNALELARILRDKGFSGNAYFK